MGKGFYLCFATQILRGVSAVTPDQISLTLRAQGITTPEGANFTFYNPAPQCLKLPALRAEVDEPGAFTTPALSPAFFHTGPAPRLRKRHIPRFRPNRRNLAHSAAPTLPTEPASAGLRREPSCLPPPASICLENPCWGSYSTQPSKRPHRGSQRGYCLCCLFLCIAC